MLLFYIEKVECGGSGVSWNIWKEQLVVIGDVFDRGKDVLPIYWLLYKLEKEAADAGGQLVFLLGNHEGMVLAGDLRYVKSKYLHLADTLHIPYQELWNKQTEWDVGWVRVIRCS